MKRIAIAYALLLVGIGVSLASQRSVTFPTRPNGTVTNVKDPPYNAAGDGVTDDTAAIQAALNVRGHIYVPPSSGSYVISDKLTIYSETWLEVDPSATIYEASGNNVVMLRNETITSTPTDADIKVTGGTWDNNWSGNPGLDPYFTGQAFLQSSKTDAVRGAAGTLLFVGVTRLQLENITVQNPNHFGIQIAQCYDWSAQSIHFVRTEATISDGLHINGPSDGFVIRDVQGATGDDFVALNAWDWTDSHPNDVAGDITNFLIENLRPNICIWGAVKMYLGTDAGVYHGTISDVLGTSANGGLIAGNFRDQLNPGHTTGVGTIGDITLCDWQLKVLWNQTFEGDKFGSVIFVKGHIAGGLTIDGASLSHSYQPAERPWLFQAPGVAADSVVIRNFQCTAVAPAVLFELDGGAALTLEDNDFAPVTLGILKIDDPSAQVIVQDPSNSNVGGANTQIGAVAIDSGGLFLSDNGNLSNLGFLSLGNSGLSGAGLDASLFADNTTAEILNAIVTNKADTGSSRGSGTRTIGATNTSGIVTFSGALYLNGGVVLTAAIGGTASFTNAIVDGSDSGNTSHAVTVNGPGTVRLAGNNTYSGATVVGSGTLQLDGSITGSMQVSENARLTGVGTINQDLTIDSSGVAQFNGGVFTVNGSITNNGLFILSNGAGLAGDNQSFVNNGTLDLITAGNFAPPAGFQNNGAILAPSVVRATSVSLSENTVTVTIDSYTGHIYQLQVSSVPDSNSFIDLGPPQAGSTGSPLLFSEVATGSSGAFYRVVVAP